MGLITLFILFLTISHVSLLQINSVIAVSQSGFSLKIIHSDSEESPLYPGDHLTPEERLQRLVQQSKDRARYVGLQVSSFNTTTNSIPVSYEGVGAFYVAEIGIGTFPMEIEPYLKNYLIVDTGSENLWIQCEGSRNKSQYFHQDVKLYPAGNSRSYEPLLCQDHHPLCFPERCEAGVCSYLASYPSKAFSRGVLAKEKITVNSDSDSDSDKDGLKTYDIIMGCGFWQNGFEEIIGDGSLTGKSNLVTGVLGLGSGPRSLTSQLNISTFSHCLKPYSSGEALTVPSTYLRFGSDATIGGGGASESPMYAPGPESDDPFSPPAPGPESGNPVSPPAPESRGGVSKTPIFAPPTGLGPYFLNLTGISINGIKVTSLGKRDFEYDRRTGNGGFFIDSGTPFTVMHRPNFDSVSDRIISYFNESGINSDPGLNRGSFTTCFAIPNKHFLYPPMILHFQGANFELDKPETLFSISRDDFCLGIIPSEANINLFGAMQQAGKMILYDTSEMTLSFAASDC